MFKVKFAHPHRLQETIQANFLSLLNNAMHLDASQCRSTYIRRIPTFDRVPLLSMFGGGDTLTISTTKNVY